jgi:uroporphyrinogen decarboxylase
MPAASTTNPELHESVFLKTARSEPAAHTPVWFMRQAGRSLPEYLKLREGVSMLESCMRPEMVVEITMQPVRRYGVDADRLERQHDVGEEDGGVDLDIVPGDLTPEHVPFITEAVQGLVGELGNTPLIGFAGAPFTVASYLVEGGPSKEHAKTKALMFGAPDVWDALMRKISGIAAAYLEVQVDAGASAVQLFDSWAGAVTRQDYRTHVLPHSTRVLERIGATGVPRIHFGVGTGEILDLMGEAGADVVGVDWRVPLASGIERVGGRAVQGNLDPTLVFAPTEVMLQRAAEVLEAGAAAPGHIFNLGHGVIPSTDPDQLARLTHFVQEHSRS